MSIPSFLPLYEQLKVLLTQSLVAGEWKPGEMIPSEMDLAVRYSVSQGTVRKAIDELAAENILVRKQGKGTFVATHSEEQTRLRFLRIWADSGKKETPINSVIECNRSRASGEVAKALKLRMNSPVYAIKRVLSFSDQPLIFDEIILSANLFKGLSLQCLNEIDGSMYTYFENKFGIRMIRAEERLKAIAATGEVARYLNVVPGTPLLCINRVAFTYGNEPVEWRYGLCHTDTYSYYNELA